MKKDIVEFNAPEAFGTDLVLVPTQCCFTVATLADEIMERYYDLAEVDFDEDNTRQHMIDNFDKEDVLTYVNDWWNAMSSMSEYPDTGNENIEKGLQTLAATVGIHYKLDW